MDLMEYDIRTFNKIKQGVSSLTDDRLRNFINFNNLEFVYQRLEYIVYYIFKCEHAVSFNNFDNCVSIMFHIPYIGQSLDSIFKLNQQFYNTVDDVYKKPLFNIMVDFDNKENWSCTCKKCLPNRQEQYNEFYNILESSFNDINYFCLRCKNNTCPCAEDHNKNCESIITERKPLDGYITRTEEDIKKTKLWIDTTLVRYSDKLNDLRDLQDEIENAICFLMDVIPGDKYTFDCTNKNYNSIREAQIGYIEDRCDSLKEKHNHLHLQGLIDNI